MKKLLLALPFMLSCVVTEAKKVKFSVDMAGVSLVSSNGIHVMGDFQTIAGYPANWEAHTTLLTGQGSNQIYSIVLDLPAFQKYEYKFVNGDQSYEAEFVPDESRVDPIANDNRWIYVDSLAADTTDVGALMFGDQSTGAGNAPFGKTLIRFKVNMKNNYPLSGTGIHVAGNFQGWDPATARMYSFSDSIFQYMAYVTAGTYQYKYYNGNVVVASETVPTGCEVSGNRSITVTTHTVINPVCFSSCNTCFPTEVGEVSELETISIAPNPARDYVSLNFGNVRKGIAVVVLDMSGREVASYWNINSSSLKVDLRELPTGIYLIKVTDDKRVQTLKILHQ